MKLTGDLKDGEGRAMEETLELWYRDPVECIQELIGNPMFRDVIRYAPERVFQDRHGKVRQIDETWTADWWWRIQVR